MINFILYNILFIWVIFVDKTHKNIGSVVAVLDTGIYPHRDFGNRILEFQDFVNNRAYAYDDNSHGTHVAGIIAGDGTASNGKYCGLAPNSRIIALKVLDRNGEGNTADVVTGLRWVMMNRERFDIRIVNLSFGTTAKASMGSDSLLIQVVERVWDEGIVVVTAAGNNGPAKGTITVPGISRKVITVGAFDDAMYTDERGIKHINYSGRGPTKECIVKPEIVTAGSGIVSCANQKDRYSVKSGTSMSAPIVTAAVALLLERYPHMTPAMVKMRLHDRAVKLKLSKEHQGWGMLDLKELLRP